MGPGQRICARPTTEGMMESVKDDFNVEDESPEELKRSLAAGQTVLVIPSRLRRQLRHQLSKARQLLAEELHRAAEHVATGGPILPGRWVGSRSHHASRRGGR